MLWVEVKGETLFQAVDFYVGDNAHQVFAKTAGGREVLLFTGSTPDVVEVLRRLELEVSRALGGVGRIIKLIKVV